MKKIFTLAAAALMSIGMWAAYPTATTTYALEDLTFTEATLTYEKTGLSGDAQKLNKVLYIDVEVPCASAHGDLYMRSSSSNTGRFATIWGNNGTERDESRKVAMKNGNSDPIAFTASDILEADGKYYIRFSSADNAGSYFDYKITGFSYVLAEECVNKTIVSQVETLTGVSANGVAMSQEEFDNLLLWHGNAGFPNDEFAAAPTFVFYRNTVITYDDKSTKEINDSIEVVGVEDVIMGDWIASATIGGVEYSVYAGKAVAVTITYMDGETVLGTEIIAEADYAEDYVNFESKPLATFLGWFSDPELTTPVDFTIPVYTDITVYAKFEKAYASSLNIEQYVLDNGMNNLDGDHIGEAFAAVLNSVHYAYENINALDTLNDDPSKTNRNYAFLGLKIKNTNGYMACWLQAGHTINVRFGNVGGDFKVAVNGAEQTLTAADYANTSVESSKVLSFTAEEDALLEIKGSAGNKTLVIKQIMIDEPIADVVLPDPLPTGINNAEEAVKAVKVIRNGQLFIEKNGVLFNAQGAIVK